MKTYIIVDHGATFMHTHHGHLISGFVSLLDNKNCDYKVFLPFGSQLNLQIDNNKLKKNLLPCYHPRAFDFSKLETYLPALLNLVYRFTKNNFLYKVTSKLLSNYVIRNTIFRLNRTGTLTNETIILFPTACPVSLLIGLELHKRKVKVEIVYRLTNTAENRNYFSPMINLNEVIAKLSKSNQPKVKFCYETNEYAATFGIHRTLLEFSPSPPSRVESVSKIENENVVISMLGIAQNHKKRIEALREIFHQNLSFSGFQTQWLIQIGESDRFDSFMQSKNLNLLIGIVDEDLMKKTLKQTSILLLLYDVNFYRTNASAMAYRAADYLLPIITYSGSAFANEISKFHLGKVIDNISDLKSAIEEIVTSYKEIQLNIDSYNTLRQSTNYRILYL